MNEPSEATHYQIELTSRQVLTALGLLLTCLFAAFFAGVWIGRSAAADAAALELASVDEIARADEQFDFFSRTTLPPGSRADGPAGSAQSEGDDDAETSSGRDSAYEPARPAAGERDALGSAPAEDELEPVDPESLFEDPEAANGDDELPPPEEMGRGGRRRRAAAREDAADVTATDPDDATEAAPPDSPPPAPPSAAPAASGFHIQVLATSDRRKAEALIARLVDADFKAFLVPSNEGSRTVYRVRVGPFPDRALATRQAADLESRWGLDSWISPGTP